jgi:hypothetical protein
MFPLLHTSLYSVTSRVRSLEFSQITTWCNMWQRLMSVICSEIGVSSCGFVMFWRICSCFEANLTKTNGGLQPYGSNRHCRAELGTSNHVFSSCQGAKHSIWTHFVVTLQTQPSMRCVLWVPKLWGNIMGTKSCGSRDLIHIQYYTII